MKVGGSFENGNENDEVNGENFNGNEANGENKIFNKKVKL